MGRRFGRSFNGTKFNNRITIVNGRKFHSSAEAHWYEYLLTLESSGLVRNLICQPRFDMLVNGIHVCTYVSDFSYDEKDDSGEWVSRIDDCKGGQLDDVFKLKIKLFRTLHKESYEKFRIVWMQKRKRKNGTGDFYRVVVNWTGTHGNAITERAADLISTGRAREVFLVRLGSRDWCVCSSPPPKGRGTQGSVPESEAST